MIRRLTVLFLALTLSACAAPFIQPPLTPPAGFTGPRIEDARPGREGAFVVKDGARLPFMSRCAANEECESDDCHLFSMQGSFCTKTCAVVTDCPAPSTGCNNRGICKAP